MRLPDKKIKKKKGSTCFLRNIDVTVPGFNKKAQGTSQPHMYSFIDSTGLNTCYTLSLFCIYLFYSEEITCWKQLWGS